MPQTLRSLYSSLSMGRVATRPSRIQLSMARAEMSSPPSTRSFLSRQIRERIAAVEVLLTVTMRAVVVKEVRRDMATVRWALVWSSHCCLFTTVARQDHFRKRAQRRAVPWKARTILGTTTAVRSARQKTHQRTLMTDDRHTIGQFSLMPVANARIPLRVQRTGKMATQRARVRGSSVSRLAARSCAFSPRQHPSLIHAHA